MEKQTYISNVLSVSIVRELSYGKDRTIKDIVKNIGLFFGSRKVTLLGR
jgi:hypothetical protein